MTSKVRGLGRCLIGRCVMICASLLALAGCEGSDVTAPAPRLAWSRVASGTTENLWDVWGSSATDVWAVGYNGTIVHYDGTRWAPSIDSVSHFFQGVWGSGPTDVWAVGFQDLGNTRPVIFHYDGTGWAREVADTLSWPLLRDVWGTSASNAWAVGYAGLLLHFDGSRWTRAPLSPFFTLDHVWGTSATDIWVVGGGAFLHYDGNGWHPQSDSVLTARQLFTGWGARRDDQWAAGFVRMGFVHFDGSRWSRVIPDDTTSGLVYGMWGVTRSRIWAASRTGSTGTGVGAIWQYDGRQWSVVARHTSNLTGVWASAETDVWVVGDFGTILHGTLSR